MKPFFGKKALAAILLVADRFGSWSRHQRCSARTDIACAINLSLRDAQRRIEVQPADHRIGRANHDIGPCHCLRPFPAIIGRGRKFRKGQVRVVKFLARYARTHLIGHGIAIKSQAPVRKARAFVCAGTAAQDHSLAGDNHSLAGFGGIIEGKAQHPADLARFVRQKTGHHGALNQRHIGFQQ